MKSVSLSVSTIAQLLPARCYASVGTRLQWPCVRVCMAVYVSVTSRCFIETDGRNNLVFGMGLLSTSPTLCFKEIQVSTKIRVLPSKTFL